MSMKDYRDQIDKIDKKIQNLLNQRFSYCREIGIFKFQKNLPLRDEAREAEILDGIAGKYQKEIRDVYEVILEKSRNLQRHDYFLVGKNVGYSFSPLIYGIFGLKDYSLFNADCFEEVLKKDFKGMNVTNPYKRDAFRACERVGEAAERTGVVNVMVREEGGFFGDNTDYFGFEKLLDRFRIVPRGKKFLIIGRGATAKTVSLVLNDGGADTITHLVRGKREAREGEIEDYRDFLDYDYVINATPYGNFPGNTLEPLFPLADFRNLRGAIDVNYNPALTPLLREAKKRGIPAYDGLYMLVAQAFRNLAYFGVATEKSVEEAYWKAKLHRANIVLIGMPYSGKSTLGRKLAKVLNKHFVDIDEELKKRELDLNALYPDVERFRKAEAEETISQAKGWGKVIACGGGVVLNQEAMGHLQGNGIILFLDASPEKLAERLDGTRPLLKSREDLFKTYRERIDLYGKYADIIVPEGMSINKIKERIYAHLGD